MNLPLEYPIFLLLIPVGIAAMWKLTRQKSGIGFSSAALLTGIWKFPSPLLLERLLLSVFVAAAGIILARPTRLLKNAVPVYKEARDVTLVLDISGSMSGDRIKAAQAVISQFIEGRPQDRFALFIFNDYAYLDWPLSLDREELIFRLNRAATNGGTKIASGLIDGLRHQKKFGQNPGAIIIVSDGGSQIKPEEKAEIESLLGQTKLYWIWIKDKKEEDEDEIAREFAVYVTNLGGKVYAGGLRDLPEIFNQINDLEASPVLYEQRVTTAYNFGHWPLLALVSLLLAGLANQMREV